VAILLSFSSIACAKSVESTQLIKEQKWEQIVQEIESLTLDNPIDPKIKDVVIALNALGITTKASSEGYLDHGLPYPWVDIDDTPEIKALSDQLSLLLEKGKQEERLLKIRYPNLPWDEIFDQPDAEEYYELLIEICECGDTLDRAIALYLQPTYLLLHQFYQTVNSPYDHILMIQSNSFRRIQCLGGGWQSARSEEEKAKKLGEYQEEMMKFGHFLKERFFSTGN